MQVVSYLWACRQRVEDERTVFGEDVVEPFPEKEAFLAVDDGARGELAVVAAFGS